MALNPRETKRTIILSTEQEFKSRAVNLLTDCALAGEKYQFDKLVDAREKYLADPRIEVVLLNGAEYKPQDIFAIMGVFEEMQKERPKSKFIIFIKREQSTEVMEKLKTYPHCHVFIGMVNKRDLNSIINPIKSTNFAAFTSPIVKAAPPPEPKKTQEMNQAFTEASGHVRATVQILGELSKNRSDLESLHKIGQRFNGFVGTFAFVEGRDGYTQLMQLANMIDEITRHYNPTSGQKEITEKHFNLLLEAAKCSYFMLKELRENKLPKPEQMTQFQTIMTEYEKYTEIKRIVKANQDEIDLLLKAL